MLADRRLPFAVEFGQPWIEPQLRRAEANQFLEELEVLLLREAIEEPHEADLIGKANPVYAGVAPLGWKHIGLTGDYVRIRIREKTVSQNGRQIGTKVGQKPWIPFARRKQSETTWS